ncbi:MAG: hypothetical protein K0U41_02280 [Gammaproteobacteria bacterium]|nr:hypothetical protein [Gammaproteobacteria bacterium]
MDKQNTGDKPARRRRRRRMEKFRIDEISAVDVPAQAGALAVMMKRADVTDEEQETKKRGDLVDILTSVEEGHQHGINVMVEEEGLYFIVMFARGEDDDTSHDHMVTRDMDGNYVISENAGHTHTLDNDALKDMMFNRMTNKSAANSGGDNVEKGAMPDNKSTATTKAADDKVKTLEKQLAVAKVLAELTDDQKTYYKGLGDDSKKEFLTKSSEERQNIIDTKKASNSVVYTAKDGTEFLKSDDPRLVGMAKKMDADAAKLEKALLEKADMQYQKRVEDEFSNLPGTVDTKVAMLKALDSIEDEEVRKASLETLKAQNASLAPAFTTVGMTKSAGTVNNSDAEQQLDTLAKKHQADNNVDYYTAYDAVSKANPDLYTKAVGQ